MKKIIYVFLITALLTSCGDDYVTLLPYGKIIPTNTDDLAEILNVTTDINTGGQNFGNQSDDVVIPEENLSTSSVANINAYTWQDYMYQVSDQDKDWVSYYKIISRANFVIENIDTYEKGTLYSVEDTRGRAHFIRANAYFYLINGYANHYNAETAQKDLGVPMPQTLDINALTPRSTVQEVYDLILSDLDVALNALPETAKHKTYGSKAAVHALLGRIYLYQKKYNLSAEHSKKSFDIYSDIKDYNEISYRELDYNRDGVIDYYSDNNIEGIMNYDNNKMSNPENLFVMEKGVVRMNLFLSNEFVNLFNTETDLRFKYFMSNRLATGKLTTGEYYMATNEAQKPWSGIKTTEVLLNYCEALMKKGTPNSTEAVIYLNRLREKRYDNSTYTPFQHTDDATTLSEIMLERRKELRLTAWRWFDMKRLGLTHSRVVDGQTYTINESSNNYTWAIPQNIIDLNPLEQNPRGL